MANPFDKFDENSSNPFDRFDQPIAVAPGFIPTVKRTAGQMLTGAARTIEDVTGPNRVVQSMRDTGQGIIDRNPAGIQSLSDVVESPWLTVKEAVGNMVPQIGTGIAGRAAGAALGAKLAGQVGGGRGALIGGIAGALAPVWVQEYGGIRDEQIQGGQESIPRALGAATVATGLELLGPEGRIAAKGVNALARTGKQIAKQGVRDFAVEGLTEAAQTAVEQVGAFKDPLTKESLHETALSGVMGGIGGGVVGGVHAAVGSALAPRPVQQSAPAAQQPDTGAQAEAQPLRDRTTQPVVSNDESEAQPLATGLAPAVTPQTADEIRGAKLPEAGPLSGAINAGIESDAAETERLDRMEQRFFDEARAQERADQFVARAAAREQPALAPEVPATIIQAPVDVPEGTSIPEAEAVARMMDVPPDQPTPVAVLEAIDEASARDAQTRALYEAALRTLRQAIEQRQVTEPTAVPTQDQQRTLRKTIAERRADARQAEPTAARAGDVPREEVPGVRAAARAAPAPEQVQVGATITLSGKPWTVKAVDAAAITLDDGAGTIRTVWPDSRTAQRILQQTAQKEPDAPESRRTGGPASPDATGGPGTGGLRDRRPADVPAGADAAAGEGAERPVAAPVQAADAVRGAAALTPDATPRKAKAAQTPAPVEPSAKAEPARAAAAVEAAGLAQGTNQEPRGAPPVAESLAPGRSADGGEGGVAPTPAAPAPGPTTLRDRLASRQRGEPPREAFDALITKMAADEAAAGNVHEWAGQAAFDAGFKRVAPPEYDKQGDNAKAWLRGWDRASEKKGPEQVASAPTPATPKRTLRQTIAKRQAAGNVSREPEVPEMVDGQSKQEQNAPQEAPSDERRSVHGQGPEALEAVAAREGGRTESTGAPEQRGDGGGEARGRTRDRADAAGLPPARSRRSGDERAHPAGAGVGRRARGLGSQGTEEAGRGVSAQPADHAVANLPAQDFRITPDLRLGQGGEVEKFSDNLAAIRTLQSIEAERRRATPAEQRVLARYVGWGGLANAFPDPVSGAFKERWQARGEELRALLTPAEYAAARRSTRNAHYTSPEVVSAMWDAARRLGFRGGLVLESSAGTGNFLGLRPGDLPARVIGIEYDSLTARIAAALYPQAAVLHSGFQHVPLADNAFALNIGNPPFGNESLRFRHKPELHGVSIHNQFFRAGLDAVRPGGLQIMVVSRFLMDAQDPSNRLALARKARLIAAIRLPDTAFKQNARTEVVTDIVILQRLDAAEQAAMEAAVDARRAQPKKGQVELERQRLAAQVPSWVDTTPVRDPLGGEPMVVNRYFADEPGQVLGVMERSGSMAHGADITVRLDDPKALAGMLEKAVARLPENVSRIGDEVLKATEERFTLLADSLRIGAAAEEVGHLKFDAGRLVRVVEREAPDGGTLFARQDITPRSPWSSRLSMDDEGRWYTLEVQTGGDGKPTKVVKDGKPTKRNVFERTVYQTEDAVPDGLRLGQAGYDRLERLVQMRDLLKRQLELETADAPAEQMEANRKRLAKAYGDFTREHGPVNRPPNLRLVQEMPDSGLVSALESAYEPERNAAQAQRSGLPQQDERATPAPILRERVVPKYEPPTTAASAADALAVTLAERGRVDIERIASLRGLTVDEAAAELQAGERPLVFKDPETNEWETADAYLSGQVRRKLNAARAAGMQDNVRALERVQPEPWTAENVTAQLGATWIPPEVYAQFAESMLGGQARVTFSALTNSFTAQVEGASPAKAEQWGSAGARAEYILNRLLNSQNVVVTTTDSEGRTHVDQERTALAGLKAREMVNEFGDWVFKDTKRRQGLVTLFNDKFNNRVVRQFDGSHLVLPGKVPDAIVALRRHQKNAVWRGIASRFLLLDHVVGAGKTYTLVARAMEIRRMGIARKPAVVVPNHLVEQWEADVRRLYPGAKVLAAGQKDFAAPKRRRLFGRIATGDWDLVIIPHSSFGFIGIAPETEMRFLEAEMQEAQAAIKEAQAEAGDTGRRKPFGVKEAERLAEKIQARMDKLSEGSRDRLLTFEQLGIDDLSVDEAHEYKNLFYSSRLTGVRGMGNRTGSRKAADLYNKVRVLRENGGAVTFATGTPVSNSAVELYTMTRYLAADELAEQGLTHFDAWRTQYVEATPAFEPTESGRLKEVTRLGRTWSNMRSLMDLYYQFADAVTIDDIKRWYAEDNNSAEFPVPKVKGGERRLVKLAPTTAQESELQAIIGGFDRLDSIADPFERNKERLRLMDRARKVSLDIRAAQPGSKADEKGGKLDVIAREVKRIYDGTSADRGTQAVFLDRSVPKAKGDDKLIQRYDELITRRDKALREDDESAFQDAADELEKFDANEVEALRAAQTGGWNAYQQLKDNLVALGVPANEIRFIQEANNDEQKQALFDAVNGGRVRVLIGSTPRMGAGTNIQQRLVALHHADVTWKPSDIEQREGRIIRQGNELLAKHGTSFEVEILAYATERTIDAKMWDLNATKLRTINGLRKYDGAFAMEIEDEESVSMAEMAALASGNPLLLERVKLESEIGNLELQERAHQRTRHGLEDQVSAAEQAIADNPGRIERLQEQETQAKQRVEPELARAAQRGVTVEGARHTTLRGALAAAQEAIAAQQAGDEKARYAVNVDGARQTSKGAIEDAIGAALGDAQPFAVTIDGRQFTQRTAAGREAAERLNNEVPKLGASQQREVPLGKMFGWDVVADLSRTGDNVQIDVSVIDGERTVASVGVGMQSVRHSFSTAKLRDALGELWSSVQRRADVSADVKYLREQAARAERDLPGLRERSGQGFPKRAELVTKRERLNAVVQQLTGAAPQAEKTEQPQDGAKFSRAGDFNATGQGGGVALADLRVLARSIKLAYPIRAAASFAEWPAPLRKLAAEAPHSAGIRGAFWDGEIWLAADRIPDLDSAQRIVLHEATHAGFEALFGADREIMMMALHRDNDAVRAAVATLRERMPGIGVTEATEEVLADLAADGAAKDLKGWRRFVAAVKHWLRRHGFTGSFVDRFTDDDVLYLLGRAGKAAQGSVKPEGGAKYARRAMFERGDEQARAGTVDLLRSSQTARALSERAVDLLRSDSTVGILGRTVGTPYHLAHAKREDGTLRNPDLRAVYDEAQDYLNDINTFANDPAELAPRVTPMIGKWSDLLKPLRLQPAAREKVSRAVFEGTLAGESVLDGRRWTDAELRERFGFEEGELGLYHEVRSSVDRSIDLMAAAEVARHLGSDLPGPIRRMVSDGDTGRFKGLVTAFLQQRAESDPRWSKLAADVATKYDRAEALKQAGYMPLMRFGRYTLTVRDDVTGEVQFFGMYETQAERNVEARRMRRDPPFVASNVERGEMSIEDWKLFKGVSPETMELFGEVAGIERTDVFNEYLRLTKAQHSAMKRLIERKGTAGYSQDVQRVLAAFLTSNARAAASNLHAGQMEAAAQAIDKSRGRIRDYAVQLAHYVQNPQDEGQTIRGLLFVQYLGGSIASALVNTTQPFTMTYPFLSQHSDPARAATLLGAGMRDALRRVAPDTPIGQALHRAEREGIVSPQTLHELQGQATNRFGGLESMLRAAGVNTQASERIEGWLRKGMFAWGGFFSLAEQFNRRSTFIAAFRLATEKGLADPFGFAVEAVHDTQGTYNRGNRPQWARGPVGATVMCVDEATEALTSRGWLTIDQVQSGDLFASFDLETQRLVWMPAKDIYRSDRSGPMLHIHGRSLDMLTTPDHRCVTYRRRRVPGARAEEATFESLEIQEAQHLNHSDCIPSAAPFDHSAIGEPVRDALVPVLGWVITEGCFYPDGYVCIYQNENRFADAIRADLTAAGIQWTETSHKFAKGNGLHTRFFINKSRAEEIRDLLPTKQLTPGLLMRLSVDQVRVLVDKMIDGDGSVQVRDKEWHAAQRVFIQNPGPTLEAFQMALTMLGISFSVVKHNAECRKVILRGNSRHHVGRATKETVHYDGRIWCPMIPGTQTWVARRSGKPFITHNTFKQFSINYVEFLSRLPRREKALALAVLVVAAGLEGLPFSDDLDDLIDTLSSHLGYSFSAKRAKVQFLSDTLGLGRDAAEWILRGATALPGVPIDLAGRMSLGNMIPGTALMLKDGRDKSSEVLEALGPAGGVVRDALQGKFAPVAARNAAKAAEMLRTGEYRDERGRKVASVDEADAAMKALGFQPQEIARQSRHDRIAQGVINRTKAAETEIVRKWAQGIADNEPEAVADARRLLAAWNERNPDTKIRIDRLQIAKAVRDMRATREQRMLKAAPRELRSLVTEQ